MSQMEWHKINSLRWLTGSIRKDLDSKGRGVWADLLALSGISRRRGYIERSEGIGYERDWVSSFLCSPRDDIDDTVDRCLFEGRLTDEGNDVLKITNWDEHQEVPEGKRRPHPASKEARLQRRAMFRKWAREFPQDATEILSEVVGPVILGSQGELLSPSDADDGVGKRRGKEKEASGEA